MSRRIPASVLPTSNTPVPVFIFQVLEGGIPEEPIVFTDEGEARARWLMFFDEGYCFDTEGERLTREEAEDEFVIARDKEGGCEVRQWVVQPDVPS